MSFQDIGNALLFEIIPEQYYPLKLLRSFSITRKFNTKSHRSVKKGGF